MLKNLYRSMRKQRNEKCFLDEEDDLNEDQKEEK
jgi:hypothetical protein